MNINIEAIEIKGTIDGNTFTYTEGTSGSLYYDTPELLGKLLVQAIELNKRLMDKEVNGK